MDNRIRGKYGEDLAVSYLEKKGFEIIERNFRHRRAEIDLIGVWKNELLVFFEVKLRKNNAFGEPETFVSRQQRKRIVRAASYYTASTNWPRDIRFDIISICGDEIVHLTDVFF